MVARLVAAGALLDRQDEPRSVRDRPRRRSLALRCRRATRSTIATSPADPARARRSLSPSARSASRSAPTPPARVAFRPRSTTSSASSRAAASVSTTGVVPGLPVARLRFDLRADGRRRGRRRRCRPRLRRGPTRLRARKRTPPLRAVAAPAAVSLRDTGRRGAGLSSATRTPPSFRTGRSPSSRWAAQRGVRRFRAVPRGRPPPLRRAFVAERLEAAGPTLANEPGGDRRARADDPGGSRRFDARAAFAAQHRLATCGGRRPRCSRKSISFACRRRRPSTRSTKSRRRRSG